MPAIVSRSDILPVLLTLAIAGQAAGDPSAVPFPVRYEIDYVRVYQ